MNIKSILLLLLAPILMVFLIACGENGVRPQTTPTVLPRITISSAAPTSTLVPTGSVEVSPTIPATMTPTVIPVPTAAPAQIAIPSPSAIAVQAWPTPRMKIPPTPTPIPLIGVRTPTKIPPTRTSSGVTVEDLIPVGSPDVVMASFPEMPLPIGEPIKISNSFIQVTAYNLYAFYDDYQVGRLAVHVADLTGVGNDFRIGLISDIPDGWTQDGVVSTEATAIPGDGGILELDLPRLTSEQPQEGLFRFKVWVEDGTYDPLEFSVRLLGYPKLDHVSYGRSDNDGTLTGIVRDSYSGEPITGAQVTLWLGPTNRFMPYDMLAVTRDDGGYNLRTWSIDLVNSYFEPYTVVPGYVLMAQKPGYHTYVSNNYVKVNSESPTNLDIKMTPLSDAVSLDLKWEIPLWSPGVWEIEMNEAWDRFAVALGKHPDPGDPETWPTQLPYLDSDGNILWSAALPDQSWAVDVSSDGSLVAGATHAIWSDNFLYLWNEQGTELWKAPLNSESLDVDISTDNEYVATGKPSPDSSVGLYDAATGALKWEMDTGFNKIRQVDFAPDGRHIVTGPMLYMLTLAGDIVWSRHEFSGLPYVIWISSDQSRIMVPDKGDHVSMYNDDGDLLWRRMLRVLTYGAMSSDGSLVVALSHGGYLYCYNSHGDLLWYRRVPVGSAEGGAGHNGIDITPDGKYIAVGGGNYTTLLYDAQGNLLWRHQGTAVIEMSEHPYRHSTMAVRISPDGTQIVSGYGMSDPRLILFQRGK